MGFRPTPRRLQRFRGRGDLRRPPVYERPTKLSRVLPAGGAGHRRIGYASARASTATLPSFSPWRAGVKKAKRDSSHAQADRLARSRREEKASACSVRNDVVGVRSDGRARQGVPYKERKDGEVNL